MNGRELAQLHVAKGTRPIIDDIDDLRVTFGFSTIDVVTVIVESRLRGGLKTIKPLSLNCTFQEKNQLVISITFKDTFPQVPLEVDISTANDLNQQLQDFADQLLSTQNELGNNIRAVPLVKRILEEYNLLSEPIVDASESIIPYVEEPAESTQGELEAETQRIADLDNTIFTCRMCRQILFEFSELHPHTSENHNNQKCTSYYLAEPPVHLKLFSQSDAELTSAASDQSGKLICSCKASLGNWTWASHRCSCGEWIAPAFQFVKRKLDVKRKVV